MDNGASAASGPLSVPASPGRWLPRVSPATILAGGMILVIGALMIPPLFILILNSVSEINPDGSRGAFTLANYARILSQPDLYRSAWNTVLFAGLSTAIVLVAGAALAWLVERSNAPFKALAYLTTIAALGTPFVLTTAAWLFVLGRAGPLNELYRALTGSRGILFNVNSIWGMALIEAIVWMPLVFLMFSAAFRSANAEMEEAARMSGASVLGTFWRVSLRLAWPALAAAAVFVFINTLSAFDVPVLVGVPSNINVLSSDIYFSIREVPPKLEHASAFSVLLIGVISALMLWYGRLARSADRFASVTGKGYRPRPIDLGRLRWVGGGFILVTFFIVLVLPLSALIWVAATPFMAPMRLANLKLLTMKNFTAVFDEPSYVQYGTNTVTIAAIAATVAVLLAVVVGWLAARRRPGGALLDQLSTIPMLFPGIVMGVAIMQISLQLPFPIYGTIWVIAYAFVIRAVPFGLRYTYTGVLQIHRELEESAAVAGASQLQLLRRIVVPLMAPAIVSAWLFIFLSVAKELAITVLLSGPQSQTIAVAMFDKASNGQAGELAAFGLVWAALMVLVAGVAYGFMRRHSAGAFGR